MRVGARFGRRNYFSAHATLAHFCYLICTPWESHGITTLSVTGCLF